MSTPIAARLAPRLPGGWDSMLAPHGGYAPQERLTLVRSAGIEPDAIRVAVAVGNAVVRACVPSSITKTASPPSARRPTPRTR
jgi:hypothetical protein